MIPAATKAVLAVWLLLGVAACAHPERLPAVPPEKSGIAEIPGMPGVRYRTDDLDLLIEDAVAAYRREVAWRQKQGESGDLPQAEYLAISGGGDNGAFGAGLLLGWTKAGNRPQFKLVTGISTGALTAPFAFLGPDYDDVLKEVYTTISPADILRARGFFAAINNDAMADNGPLWQVVRRYATQDLLKEIAGEHERGRMLLVGTTDLDTRTGVIWNMGKIAASGHPDALNLFHGILIASAAIPGAFPPVMFDVEADDRRYQEMHVDGGVMAQVFVYPTALSPLEAAKEHGITPRKRRLFLLRNARLDPEWASVDRQTISIAGRSIATLIQTQGVANLFWIYSVTQRDEVDFNLAFIGPEFDTPKAYEFDTAYMNALFDYGFKLGAAGYPWRKTPPGLAARPGP